MDIEIAARLSLPNGEWAFSGQFQPDKELCELYKYEADDIKQCLLDHSGGKGVYIFGDSRARLRIVLSKNSCLKITYFFDVHIRLDFRHSIEIG